MTALTCFRCGADCTAQPYYLTRNDGTREGPACFECARYLNGAAR